MSNNGVPVSSASGGDGGDASGRAWARDALGAVLLVEEQIAERVFVALAGAASRREKAANVFGEPLAVERGDEAKIADVVRRAEERASQGERVAVVTTAAALASARAGLRAIGEKRLAVVAHAVGGSAADAMALADVGWGVLFAGGAGESLDLSLVARRAAEDSGNPFIVVHQGPRARHTEPVVPPTPELCGVFVGAARARMRKLTDAAHPVHTDIGERAFTERVPFALGSAMRELESLTGRHHDVLERVPAADAALTFVGLGHVGDSLVSEVDRLRAAGHDVGAVKIVAFRPFPGPRLVKALSRSLAMCVLEDVDAPLAQSNPLAREVKAAFADALTWAPEYPGVGRIPRIVTGAVGAADLEATDVAAMLHNMLADERGRRAFVLGDGALPASNAAPGPAESPRPLTLRGRAGSEALANACADLTVAVLASALGLRARAFVRPLAAAEGAGYAFDVVAGYERPRGGHAPHAVRCVLVDDAAALIQSNPFVRLAAGGVVAVPTAARSADALWAELPAYLKAIAFDRRARVVGWHAPGGGTWRTAAAVAGLAIALVDGQGKSKVDGSLVAREVEDALRTAFAHAAEEALPEEAERDTLAADGGKIARAAFESHVEVPRATVERDEEAVRFGRKDARATTPPRA